MIRAAVQKVIQQNRRAATGAACHESEARMRAANVGSKKGIALLVRLRG